MNHARAVMLLLTVAAATSCRQQADAARDQATEVATREHQLVGRLAKADADPKKTEPVAMWIMPDELKEISGLALTPDGNVLAHDDEIGRVYVIDPRGGVIVKRFNLGESPPHGDFESITVAGSDIYLLQSNGKLYEFQEGADGENVPYSIRNTGLGKDCEFESMVYEADSDWLVMPCKNVKNKSLKDQIVIYRWKRQGPDSSRVSMITVPEAQAIGSNGWKHLKPSDVTIDPATGNYVMITSHPDKAIVEITRSGQLVRSEPLPEGHNQPEGVAITRDSILMVSDEATNKPAAITLYRWHPIRTLAQKVQ